MIRSKQQQKLVLGKTSMKYTCIKMTSYKRLYSAVETAEKTMNEW